MKTVKLCSPDHLQTSSNHWFDNLDAKCHGPILHSTRLACGSNPKCPEVNAVNAKLENRGDFV